MFKTFCDIYVHKSLSQYLGIKLVFMTFKCIYHFTTFKETNKFSHNTSQIFDKVMIKHVLDIISLQMKLYTTYKSW